MYVLNFRKWDCLYHTFTVASVYIHIIIIKRIEDVEVGKIWWCGCIRLQYYWKIRYIQEQFWYINKNCKVQYAMTWIKQVKSACRNTSRMKPVGNFQRPTSSSAQCFSWTTRTCAQYMCSCKLVQIQKVTELVSWFWNSDVPHFFHSSQNPQLLLDGKHWLVAYMVR